MNNKSTMMALNRPPEVTSYNNGWQCLKVVSHYSYTSVIIHNS